MGAQAFILRTPGRGGLCPWGGSTAVITHPGLGATQSWSGVLPPALPHCDLEGGACVRLPICVTSRVLTAHTWVCSFPHTQVGTHTHIHTRQTPGIHRTWSSRKEGVALNDHRVRSTVLTFKGWRSCAWALGAEILILAAEGAAVNSSWRCTLSLQMG